MLNHARINRDDAVNMMKTYLGVDSMDSIQKLEATRGCHARFRFRERFYAQQIHSDEQAAGDDEQVMQNRAYIVRGYFLYLVGMPIFVGRCATFMDVFLLEILH